MLFREVRRLRSGASDAFERKIDRKEGKEERDSNIKYYITGMGFASGHMQDKVASYHYLKYLRKIKISKNIMAHKIS